MKTIIIISLVTLVFFALAVPVMAQDEPGLPDTAVGFGELLVGMVIAWVGGGAIGSWLTNLVKQIPGLKEGDQTKLVGTGAEFVATVLTVGAGVAFEYALPFLSFLDEAAIWPIILAIVGATPAAFIGRIQYKLSK